MVGREHAARSLLSGKVGSTWCLTFYSQPVISTDQLLQFALAAFLIIIVPGPSVLFVVSRGVALGRRAALATVLGNAVGALSQGVLVAFGLGAIVSRSVVLYTVIKFCGAAYLVWLGVKSFRERRKLAGTFDVAVEPKAVSRIIREGYIVGITNPKIVIFFSAVLPQFVDRGRGSVTAQMLVLLGVFTSIAFISDGAWGLLAGSVRRWFTGSPRRLERLVGAGGLTIMGLGVRLALTGRHD
jgi:threonine/homoserine/homoserine lactone efflux protein